MAIVTYANHTSSVSNTTFDNGAPLRIYEGTPSFSVIESQGRYGDVTQAVARSAEASWLISGVFDYLVTTGTVTDVTVSSLFMEQDGSSGMWRDVFVYNDINLSLSTVIASYKNGSAFEHTHPLVIEALKFNDKITGTTFGDTLLGYEGDDTIYGATEANASEDGADNLLGNQGRDVVFGYAGNDTLSGGVNKIDPADSADTLYGGSGNDVMYGCGGNDEIYGEAGDDLIVSADGNDTVVGGAGNDIFVHLRNGGQDLIVDFRSGDILTIERTSTVYDFASVIAHGVSDANGSYIDLGDNNGILLASGVQLSSLDAADFYFYG